MLRDSIREIEEISKETKEIYDQMIHDLVFSLDSLMNEIRTNVFDEITLYKASFYYIELSSMLYFINSKVKRLEIDRKSAKIKKQEVFDQAAIKIRQDSILKATRPSDKKTQTDINAEANEVAKENNIVYDLYDSLIEAVDSRIKDAWNMVASLKHRCSTILQEAQNIASVNTMKRND